MPKLLNYVTDRVSLLRGHLWRASVLGITATAKTKPAAEQALLEEVEAVLRAKAEEPVIVTTSVATYTAVCTRLSADGQGEWSTYKSEPGQAARCVSQSGGTRKSTEQWLEGWAWQQSAEYAICRALRALAGYRVRQCPHCSAAAEGWPKEEAIRCPSPACGRSIVVEQQVAACNR